MQVNMDVFEFFVDFMLVRGYGRPKTIESFSDRHDSKLFYKLFYLLKQDKKQDKKGRVKFLNYIFLNMPEYFNSVDIVDRFEFMYDHYKKHTYSNELAYLHRLYQSFEYINDYMNTVGMEDANHYFNTGSPPLALKHYKEDYVDEAIVAYGCDFKILKKKTWFKLYVGELKGKLPLLKTRIQYSVKIKNMMQSNFNELFNGVFISPLFPKQKSITKSRTNKK